ncbi:S26 family signal peptidase [Blastopirellula retiformator]|uniref:Signal peptidase I n=1 Tax=Blastopirellula retiformator TaxID=2527970 RepID=A0A5C5VL75_9BACT|nr:S26 family signal peptidase [Blastopirellula retiformator]TWT38575.1 signal peptidase I [Blastopirellula retiformator]
MLTVLLFVAALLLATIVIQVFSYRAAFALLRLEKGSWLIALEVAFGALVLSFAARLALNLIEANSPGGVSVKMVVLVWLTVPIIVANYIRWRLATEMGWAIAAMLIGISIGILPAFTTAYSMRTYLAEAFVVSSSSMAPTLYPGRYVLDCDDGSETAIAERDVQQVVGGGGEVVVLCPCEGNAAVLAPGQMELPHVAADRMLVGKWGLPPRRWDLVVHRNPNDPSGNYVFRLIGLPGEQVSIRAGEVWVNDALLAKPDTQHDELWFPVYLVDRDLPAEEMDSWLQTSASEGGVWKEKGWTINDDDSTLTMRGVVGDRWSYMPSAFSESVLATIPRSVADLRIDFSVEEIGGEPLEVAVDYYGRNVVWRLTNEGKLEVTSTMSDEEKTGSETSAGPAVEPGDRLSLVMRDGRLYGFCEETVLLDLPLVEEIPADWELDHFKRQVTWQASAGWRIDEIEVLRDVYYRTANEMSDRPYIRDSFRDAWDLGADELVLLGDFSSSAADSRMYQRRATTSDVIGRVLARYWPVSRWRTFP